MNELRLNGFDHKQPGQLENLRCEHPAYLFWKLQSRLVKLNQQLQKHLLKTQKPR